MALLIWRTAGGQRPRLSSRLLANDGAEIAVNTKLWSGKIRAFNEPLDVFQTVKAGPILSIFDYRRGGPSGDWLHWATDVDVATSPLAEDPNYRLYFTGDGKPKITDSSLAAGISRLVAANASSGQPTFTIVGGIKGFQAGDTVLIDYGSSVTQSAVIMSVAGGSPNSTITLTSNLTNALNATRPVTNTSKRFPLGTYDLGVPAPASSLTAVPASLLGGSVAQVGDILIAQLNSIDSVSSPVMPSEAIPLNQTFFKYLGASFPNAFFAAGDKVSFLEDTGSVIMDPVFGPINVVNILERTVSSVSSTSGTFTVNVTEPITFAYTTAATIGNKTRDGFNSSEPNPQTLEDLLKATSTKFTIERAEGAESVQFDVDNECNFTLSDGAIRRYSDSDGPNSKGAFRFTHIVRRVTDGKILFTEDHVWEIKGGRVLTPMTDGKNFKATVTDEVPEDGAQYAVETVIDRAANLFGTPLVPAGLRFTKRIVVRRANRVAILLETDQHGLVVDDKIKLELTTVSSDPLLPSLDGRTVTVTKVDGANLIAKGMIGGQYQAGGSYTQIFQDDEVSPRTYVYTYVATIGGQEMESGPSPPSVVQDVGRNQAVQLTGFINPTSPLLWDTNFTAMRLYRFQEGEDGVGSFLFHSQLAVDASTVSDNKPGDELLEPLSTIGYLPPPEDMKGLIELPNGLVAGFSGKQLLYPVPFQLHAWPLANRRTVHDAIVSLGSVGNAVIVTTVGIPRTFTGDDPESVSGDRIELVEPNLSKRGSVDMGYGYAYPGPRGLVLASPGRAEVVTEDLFTRDEWQQLNPSSFVACRFDDRYLCFYDTGGTAPSFTEHSKAGFIIDPKAIDGKARLVFLDFWASEAWDDPDTGTTYIVQDGVVRQFDAGELGLEYVYRTKPQVMPFAREMAVMRIEGPRPVRVTVLVEDEPGGTRMMPLYSTILHNSEDFPLPAGLFQRWQVEIRSKHLEEIGGIYIASSVRELQQYQGGQ